jgi:hypothetical protein
VITLLDFGSDIGLRQQLFSRASFAHPAKLNLYFLDYLVQQYTRSGDTVADPMAGVGSVLLAATLDRNVIAREIEPRWLEVMRQNADRIKHTCLWVGAVDIAAGDARAPWGMRCDHVIFSPPYGCDFTARSPLARRGYLPARMAASVRAGRGDWAAAWDRKIGQAQIFVYGTEPGQIGHLRGEHYWADMQLVYEQARASLRSGGYLIVIIKDHIVKGERVWVTLDTVALCERIGFSFVAEHKRRVYPLSLWQRRRKEQGQPVIEEESALVFRL